MFMKPSTKKKVDVVVCRYGSACTRKDCFYKHDTKSPKKTLDPLDPTVDICMAYLAGSCSFGDNCYNRHPADSECQSMVAKLATRPCKFGSKCWTDTCLYSHDSTEASLLGDISKTRGPPAPVVLASGPVFKAESVQEVPTISNLLSTNIPETVWRVYLPSIAAEAFAIEDPIARFAFVNARAKPAPSMVDNEGCFVIDLHFQSTKSVEVVLNQIFPQCIRYLSADSGVKGNIWLITGAGRHVPSGHQAKGGVLYDSVLSAVVDLATKNAWLEVAEGIASGGIKGAIRLRHKR